ncbi:hypothetical protein F7725_028863 [Dissostichus mawsoni]|uniref:Uncharacterized protein n=1 Tax=Dissostichus mawsoni TaxID=36200 RepID=A0A7J5XGU8_DISMA|nr:hypothetical protein F7725_028863 [Dissostichus mawsoni]
MIEGRLGTACILLSPPLLRPQAHIFTILRRSCLKRTPMKTYRNGVTQITKRLPVVGLGDLHNCNIPIHTNAEGNTKVPALNCIDSPERQHAQEEEVSHSQVQQVHVGHCFQAVAHSGVDPNHHQITHGTKNEDHPEERWLVLPTKLPDPASVTKAWVVSRI